MREYNILSTEQEHRAIKKIFREISRKVFLKLNVMIAEMKFSIEGLRLKGKTISQKVEQKVKHIKY